MGLSYKLRRRFIDWKLKVLVTFFKSKVIEGHLPLPPHTLSSPNASDENIEVASLFEIVQQSDNKNFRAKIPPRARGQVVT
jgi:hypothetical protein